MVFLEYENFFKGNPYVNLVVFMVSTLVLIGGQIVVWQISRRHIKQQNTILLKDFAEIDMPVARIFLPLVLFSFLVLSLVMFFYFGGWRNVAWQVENGYLIFQGMTLVFGFSNLRLWRLGETAKLAEGQLTYTRSSLLMRQREETLMGSLICLICGVIQFSLSSVIAAIFFLACSVGYQRRLLSIKRAGNT